MSYIAIKGVKSAALMDHNGPGSRPELDHNPSQGNGKYNWQVQAHKAAS
jgi:hypothetical protein